ncbi:MAG: ribosome biogenesis GTP-binding protein YihA/YsxC [Gammaproteobacteria bacterium]|nr:ribosome biogenesis GTP-binding protein YihA/YsxC [Gammaproteobacteria bacterium]
MTKLDYQKATFLLSAAKLSQLPPDMGVEVAFVGRSNAGKSSVLNQLTHNTKLARVSKTPGRTQHINLFVLDSTRRLVDLPGYGYAKVPPEVKENWQKTLGAYLHERDCLKGLILVMDIRHPLTEFDRNLLSWASTSNLAVHILLNKADKLNYGVIKNTEREVNEFISTFPNPVSCQIFSAMKGTGVKELREQLETWFA